MIAGLNGQSAEGLVDVIDARTKRTFRTEKGEAGKDFTPEEIAQIYKEREQNKYDEEKRLAEFRAMFTVFAADDSTEEERILMLNKMTTLVREDGILPERITLKDIK